MNKILPYIALISLFLFSCRTAKDVVDEKSSISAKDHPYIAKFHEGVRLKTKGRLNEARNAFEACLAIRQDDDAVYFALSQIELLSNNPELSAAYIQKAANLDPKNIWYIQELAYMYYERGDYENSVINFRKLTEIEPRNVDWLYGYAEALVKSGEPTKAIEALNKTEDRIGVNPELSIQKYNLLMSINQKEKALQELMDAKNVYPKDPQLIAYLVDHYFKTNQTDKAVIMLEELVVADPSNGRAHLALADIYQQKGDKDKAYTELKKAFESPDVELDTKMMILIRIHDNSSKIDPPVLELIELLEKMHPNEAKVFSIKGDYLLRQKKEEEALIAYRKALEFEKNQFAIWNQVLLMEYQQGKYEELYTDSKSCLELFPSNATIYLLHGVASNQLKKYDEAIEALATGIEFVLNDKAIKAEFYGQLGDAYFGNKEFDSGKKNYEKAIEIDPASSLLKNNYAFRLASAKIDLENAEKIAILAIKSAPEQAQFHDTYGWVLFQKGEYQHALEQYERALGFDSEDPLILEHIGDASFQTGKIEKALEYWKKSKELGAKNKNLDLKIQHKKYYEPLY